MKTRKILSTAAAAALSLTIFTACGSSSSDATASTVTTEDGTELQVLRVAIMTGQPDQYADYIGTEEGIFEKYGISLETTEFVAGINTVDAIVNGTADTGILADFAAVNRFGNTLHDTNLTIFSELSNITPSIGGLYVPPEYADDLSKLDGSAGWITQIGTVIEYYNWQAMTYIGLDPAKQNIVQTDSNQTSLALAKNGDASAVVATGASGKYFEEQGWVLAANASDIGIDVSSYLISTNEFASNNTELLANYLTALSESIDFINNNLDDSAEKISAKFGIEADDFKDNWTQITFNLGLTEEGADHLDEINTWAFDQGYYSESYDVRQFYYTDAVEKSFPDNVTVDLSSVEK